MNSLYSHKFQILAIDIVKELDKKSILVDVRFNYEEFEDKEPGGPWFGILGRFSKAVYVSSIEELEAFEKEEEDKDIPFEFVKREDGDYDVKGRTRPGPYELGLLRIVDIEGSDVIEKLGDNTYRYRQYLADCKIVFACLEQLDEMKRLMDSGESSSFRSADSYMDFLAILESLDKFWY